MGLKECALNSGSKQAELASGVTPRSFLWAQIILAASLLLEGELPMRGGV